jgi:rhodanese-related sulfurtransferase
MAPADPPADESPEASGPTAEESPTLVDPPLNESPALVGSPTAESPDPAEIDVEPARVAEWLAADPDLQVIDVREAYEREAGHLAGSLHIELVQLPSQAARLIDHERPVVFYCRVCARSLMAAQALRASGFQAHSMQGGLLRWAREGRPLSPADGHVADH